VEFCRQSVKDIGWLDGNEMHDILVVLADATYQLLSKQD
jgi:hypothetical protein